MSVVALTTPNSKRRHRVACPYCASEFDAVDPARHRSTLEHRRFFGMIRAAFDNWPEDHEFQPETAEHLRAWLICEASPLYRTVETISLDGAPHEFVAAMMVIIDGLLEREDGFKFCHWRGHRATITRPKSIRFDRMKHGDFHALSEIVAEVIVSALRITIKELLGESDGN